MTFWEQTPSSGESEEIVSKVELGNHHFKAEERVESYESEALWVLKIGKGATRCVGETEWNSDGYFGTEASGTTFCVSAALHGHCTFVGFNAYFIVVHTRLSTHVGFDLKLRRIHMTEL